MTKYGEYELNIEPMPASKKNRLVFLKKVVWTSEDGRTKETYDRILELEVAPLQEQLVMKALELFKTKTTEKKKK